MAKRSSVLVILGIALFVLGVAIVYLVVRDDDDDLLPVAEGGSAATVLVADEEIPAGSNGSDVLAQGKAKVKTVDALEVAPGAMTSAASLTGRVFAVAVPDGVQIREADLRPLTLRGNLPIPEGKQAVAIRVPFVPGVAGYVGPGDNVNIYAVVNKGPQAPMSKLLLSNISVLDVSMEVAPRRTTSQPATTTDEGSSQQTTAGGARVEGDSITYLVAVDAVQAERLIFVTSNDTLYLSLVPPNQQAATTGGESYQGVLR
jgi:Flp pilus assembly protein CpaB